MVLLYSPFFIPPSSESALPEQHERFKRSRREVSENESNPDQLERQRHTQAIELIHRPRAVYYHHRPLF